MQHKERKRKDERSGGTYVEESLGTSEVGGGDGGVAFDLPLVLGGLELDKGGEVNSVTVFVVGLGLGGGGELVVGESPGGGAVSVGNGDLGGGLVGLDTLVVDLLGQGLVNGLFAQRKEYPIVSVPSL